MGLYRDMVQTSSGLYRVTVQGNTATGDGVPDWASATAIDRRDTIPCCEAELDHFASAGKMVLRPYLARLNIGVSTGVAPD